jgi:hypothetical protein
MAPERHERAFMSSPSSPSPFTINVPDAVLRDLAGRLARTRFPERTAAPGGPAPTRTTRANSSRDGAAGPGMMDGTSTRERGP